MKAVAPHEIDRPTAIDVVVTVASQNAVASPISGLRAEFVHLQVLERLRESDMTLRSLGSFVFGDLVSFVIEAGVLVDVVVRRVRFGYVATASEVQPLTTMLAEVVPLLANVKTALPIVTCERLVLEGETFRCRATVERVSSVPADGYRSGVTTRLVVRDDLAEVRLDPLS